MRGAQQLFGNLTGWVREAEKNAEGMEDDPLQFGGILKLHLKLQFCSRGISRFKVSCFKVPWNTGNHWNLESPLNQLHHLTHTCGVVYFNLHDYWPFKDEFQKHFHFE